MIYFAVKIRFFDLRQKSCFSQPYPNVFSNLLKNQKISTEVKMFLRTVFYLSFKTL